MALINLNIQIDTEEDAELAATRVLDVLGRLTQHNGSEESAVSWDPQGAVEKIGASKPKALAPKPKIATAKAEVDSGPKVTKVDLQHAMTPLVKDHKPEIKKLFEKFGAGKLSELKEVDYPAFKAALGAL